MRTVPQLRFGTGHSTRENLAEAIDEATGQLLDALDARVDLAFAFVSSHHVDQLDWIAPRLAERIAAEHLVGCSAESLVADYREIEWRPAVSLWAARLPAVDIRAIHLSYEQKPDGGVFIGWPDDLVHPWPEDSVLLALGDPFSFHMEELLVRLNEDRPGVPVIGGLCSGGGGPGQGRLILGGETYNNGAVVIRLSGDVSVQQIVSQGCRPIGQPMIVTRADGNRIDQLGGKPALDQLKHIYSQLPTSDQRLVNQGLHLGRAISEYRETFSYGDFLIRNVVSIDEQTGAIAVADLVRVGQTVQFHVRDHNTAHVDLQQMLSRAARGHRQVRAGLLFSCNGRGSRFFGSPDHDARLIQQFFGPISLAGFFAAGEIGPVGERNFLHGFTACLALFGKKEDAPGAT